MVGVVLALLVLGYLIFLIDWRDLRAILAQGGWATACFFVVVTILIVSVVVSPGTNPPTGLN
jgi:hypothetical protein